MMVGCFMTAEVARLDATSTFFLLRAKANHAAFGIANDFS
jgi:hypothetical protein